MGESIDLSELCSSGNLRLYATSWALLRGRPFLAVFLSAVYLATKKSSAGRTREWAVGGASFLVGLTSLALLSASERGSLWCWAAGFALQKGAGLFLGYWAVTTDLHTKSVGPVEALQTVKVTVSVREGKGLTRNNTKKNNKRKKAALADPYVEVFWGDQKLGQTPVAHRTLDPTWAAADTANGAAATTFECFVVRRDLEETGGVDLKLWHHGSWWSRDEPMGSVLVPVPAGPGQNHREDWHPVRHHPEDGDADAGALLVAVTVAECPSSSPRPQDEQEPSGARRTVPPPSPGPPRHGTSKRPSWKMMSRRGSSTRSVSSAAAAVRIRH